MSNDRIPGIIYGWHVVLPMFMPSSVNRNRTYAICPGDSFVTGHISLSMFHVNWRRIILEINILEIGALITALALFGVLYFLKRKHVDFGIRTLIATAFGVIIGLIFKENYKYVAAFGTVYVNALQAFVVPLLLFSVISSITNLGDQVKLHKVGLKSVLFLLLVARTA